MDAIDLPYGQTSISGLTAISRYRERKLVPQFWQDVRINNRCQFPRFSNWHVQSLPSSHATSVYRGLNAEVVPKDIPQTKKTVGIKALRFKEQRPLSSVTSTIIHEPDRE